MERTATMETRVKTVKKIPASENGPEVRCETKSKQKYTVSWCIERSRFTLWRRIGGVYELVMTAKSPLELYDKIPWDK